MKIVDYPSIIREREITPEVIENTKKMSKYAESLRKTGQIPIVMSLKDEMAREGRDGEE